MLPDHPASLAPGPNVVTPSRLVGLVPGIYVVLQAGVQFVAFITGIGRDVHALVLAQSTGYGPRYVDLDLGDVVSDQLVTAAHALETHGIDVSEVFSVHSVTDLKVLSCTAERVTFYMQDAA